VSEGSAFFDACQEVVARGRIRKGGELIWRRHWYMHSPSPTSMAWKAMRVVWTLEEQKRLIVARVRGRVRGGPRRDPPS